MDSPFPLVDWAPERVRFRSESTRTIESPRRTRITGPRPEVIAALEEELAKFHRLAREKFGFRRVEMVTSFEDETARLETPRFDFRLDALADPDDAERFRWVREVTPRLQGSLDEEVLALFGDELDTLVVRFAEVLDIAAVIDRIESSESGLRVDYDLHCRWCEVRWNDVPAVLRLEGKEMTLVADAGRHLPLTDLARLLQSTQREA